MKQWPESKVREVLESFAVSGSLAETSRETGVPKPTIFRWVADNPEKVAELKEKYYGARTDKFIKEAAEFKTTFSSEVRLKLLDCVAAVSRVLNRPKITGQDVGTLVRELTKAMQLIQGEPTERTEVNVWEQIKQEIDGGGA